MNSIFGSWQQKHRRWTLLGIVVVIMAIVRLVVIWQVTQERIDHERDEALHHAYVHNGSLASVIAMQTTRTLQGIEKIFTVIQLEYQGTGPKTDLTRLLAESALDPASLNYLALIDEAGKLVAGPDTAVAANALDREYFLHHKTTDGSALYIAAPVQGRGSAPTSIDVSRRINRADGSFAGVIVAGVNVEQLTDPYLASDVGLPHLVVLAGQDKVVRAARGAKSGVIADVPAGGGWDSPAVQPAGNITASQPDGVDRIFSYRRLSGYPLLVAVGTARAAALADVVERRKRTYALAGAATLTVFVVAFLLLWLLRRQQNLLMSIRNSSALQRASFNLAAIGMSHIDLDGAYRRVNEKLCNMLGLREHELIGKSMYDQVYAEDRDAYQLFLEDLRNDPGHNLSRTIEVRFLHADGSVFWTLASVSVVLQMDDSDSYFISALQDITARKNAALALQEQSAQLGSAFDSSAIGMALATPEGHWLKVNPTMCEMLGYSNAELMASSLLQITHPEDLALCRQQLLQLQAGEGDEYRMEKRHLNRQGQALWVSQLITMARSDEGQPQHVIVQVQDINQQKRAEAELGLLTSGLEERVRQRTDQLHFATREITDFSYSMAHDLRQPLSSIMGFSDLLERELSGQLNHRGRHCLARIRAGVRQISDLTDALLALARLSSVELRWEQANISEMARRALERCRQVDPGRAARIQVQPDMQARGDPQLLSVVVDNLIENAWKFSSRMAQTVIEVGSDTTPDGETIYYVRDQGAGFDMAYNEKLFGNFQRLHSPSEFLGHGIGLASARRVITRHGGRIWAQSEPDKGAVFYFTLGKAPA